MSFRAFRKGSPALLPRLASGLSAAALLTLLACGGGGGGTGSGTYGLVPYLTGVSFPTQIRFAPDGRLFYTELQTGNVRIVLANGTLLTTPFATLPVGTSGEQGLLGLALDPNYAVNRFVYVFHTHPSPLRQRVVRFTDTNNVGTSETVIVDDLPVGTNHCGGRLGFGADGKLYVTVGDIGNPANSQSDSSLAGKLLRYNADGTIPSDNPIAGNALYAKGLRNPFGLAFHPTSGRPYVSENGPTCDDELNRIVAGGNYGWRSGYACGDPHSGFVGPMEVFNPSIAPTGASFYTGSSLPEFTGDLMMASYRDGALRRFRINDSTGVVLAETLLISGRAGGVLDVTTSPGGDLFLADSSGIYRVMRL
jgi:aldose sugar dehydrogenase